MSTDPQPIFAPRRGASAAPFTASPLVLSLAIALALLATAAAEAQEPKVDVVAELRVRPEFRNNANFNSGVEDRFRYYGQRTRLGAQIEISPKVGGRVVAQDTRFWGTTPVFFGADSTRSNLDLLEGYIELKWIWDLPLDMRLGRQPFEYGRERLIGPDDWSNMSRTFDAYQFHFGLGVFFIDVFSSKLVDTNTPLALGTGPVRSDQDINFSGVYFSKEGDRLELLDLYWLRIFDKSRPATGDERRHTFGTLGRYAFTERLRLEVEYAYQSGDSAGVDIRAQAVAAELAWESGNSRALQVDGGFDWATGDQDGAESGRIETFRQLFPSPHLFLGAMDYVGRQNVKSFWARVAADLTGAIRGTLSAHHFRLDNPADAWYGIEGLPRPGFGRDPQRTERELGTELDLDLTLDMEGADIGFGYSRFFTGRVVGLGGRPNDHSDWVYGAITIGL